MIDRPNPSIRSSIADDVIEMEKRFPYFQSRPVSYLDVKLIQRTRYPWSGEIALDVQPKIPTVFTLRLRIPAWAKSHALSVNGEAIKKTAQRGWLSVHRQWTVGDQVQLNLAMDVERITLPAQFKDYEHLAAHLLGGVTVLKGRLPQANPHYVDERPVEVMFIPYGVWDNRKPGAMRIWLSTRKASSDDLLSAFGV